MWRSSTTEELRVPIGRTGATKLQYLAIGKGTRQHALFAGKTGSGKSTLFHVIITNLALWCSPDEVEFYLIDFKKGVEFKCYATHRLPHARVVAIESDRQFGLSVLQRLDEELRRRGDLFRKVGAQDLAGYRRAAGAEPLPRSLLLIDEFQEYFTEDDAVAQNASVLLDRIVRQGRAFGIHVLLGSQTLGGAYTLARTTLGQMVIRVALQCNEADAFLIMDDGNAAPRLLTRPGEGIYNDAAGAIEGNSPFQVVWLPDQERDSWLERTKALQSASGKRWAAPVVFEGNAPAEIADNELLTACLRGAPLPQGISGQIWLGAPNSIKGPTEVRFTRQSGQHLLLVGQREEAALAIFGLAALSLSAPLQSTAGRVILLDASMEGSAEHQMLTRFVQAARGSVLQRITPREMASTLQILAEELQNRAADDAKPQPPLFLIIPCLQRFKKLCPEDEYSFGGETDASPAGIFTQLITQGSSHGIHILTSVDGFNNVNRWLNRKVLREFEIRVIFQMSANDSASLIDSSAASTLGLHKALLYHEQMGSLETFRPYALPDSGWLESIV
jgi:hypothetical protein